MLLGALKDKPAIYLNFNFSPTFIIIQIFSTSQIKMILYLNSRFKPLLRMFQY